jgi:hypothetical protein
VGVLLCCPGGGFEVALARGGRGCIGSGRVVGWRVTTMTTPVMEME